MAVKTVAGQAQVSQLVKLYSQAEQEIAQKIALALARNGGQKKVSIRQLEQQLKAVKSTLKDLQKNTEDPVSKLIDSAFNGGLSIARKEIKKAGIPLVAEAGGVNAKAMNVYSSQVYERLMDVVTMAGRTATDVYKALEMDSAMIGLVSGFESLDAVKRKVERIAEGNGLVAFVDKKGRQWSMGNYVDMLLRTSSMKVFNEARKSEYLRHNEDLVIVSFHEPTCEMCEPWNGVILSLTGATDGYQTLEQAQAAGLFHPNCRHAYSLYIPDDPDLGVLKNDVEPPEEPEAGQEDPDPTLSAANREADLRNLFAAQVPASDIDFVVEAFKDSDAEISALIDKYGAAMKYDVTAGHDHYYNGTIYINRGGHDIVNTVRHEVGHYIDQVLPSQGMMWSHVGDFADAVAADKKLFTGNSKTAIAFKQSMKDAMQRGEMYYNNGAVSDIFCSLTKGNIAGSAGHATSYYQGLAGSMRANAEVFAELFELKAKKDYAAIDFVRSFFPSIVAEFEKLMKGGVP